MQCNNSSQMSAFKTVHCGIAILTADSRSAVPLYREDRSSATSTRSLYLEEMVEISISIYRMNEWVDLNRWMLDNPALWLLPRCLCPA